MVVVVEAVAALEDDETAEIEIIVNQNMGVPNFVSQKMARPCTRSTELRTVHASTADGTRVPGHILQVATKPPQSTQETIIFKLT